MCMCSITCLCFLCFVSSSVTLWFLKTKVNLKLYNYLFVAIQDLQRLTHILEAASELWFGGSNTIYKAMPTNIINQLRDPYAESFINIKLHLDEILRCVTQCLTDTQQTTLLKDQSSRCHDLILYYIVGKYSSSEKKSLLSTFSHISVKLTEKWNQIGQAPENTHRPPQLNHLFQTELNRIPSYRHP